MYASVKKYVIFALILSGMAQTNYAHEPLYGLGPHVLFKNGFAPHFTLHMGDEHVETEYAIGYGLTKDWTLKAEIPFHMENGNYNRSGFHIKQKYRVFSYFEPGLSRQISAVSTVSLPAEDNGITEVKVGLAGGQEALHWYWFASGSYGMRFKNRTLKPGNQLTYSATLGYRPINTSYYKPDIVFFLEGLGKFQQHSTRNGETIPGTGGQTWSVVPSFMLTYKNVALRGGVEFGLAGVRYLDKPETNYKIILEWHL